MTIIENKKFMSIYLENNQILENIIFKNCEFEGCVLSFPKDENPKNRTIIKNCEFQKCNIYLSYQSKGTLENVLFKDITMGVKLMRLSGFLLNKVKLQGNFNSILISSSGNGILLSKGLRNMNDEELKIYNQFVENYYKTVDWAIDISEAKFKECDLRSSIPAHLVIRDSETQMLLKYEKVKNSDWQNNNRIMNNFTAKSLCEDSLNIEKKDYIVIAPKRHKKKFAEIMEAIKILREEGIGELD